MAGLEHADIGAEIGKRNNILTIISPIDNTPAARAGLRAGDLIGLPVLDFDDLTIGYVRQVVRKADDSIVLIVPYGGFLGLNKRPVAVPIETVVILARQLDALDFTRDDFKKAPAWMAAEGREIAASDMISIGLGRR